MGKKFIQKPNHLRKLRVKLSFDDGFAENPLYSIKAFTNEKFKGISMIELIEDNFKITKEDRDLAYKKKMEEWQEDFENTGKQKNKFTRDEKGNFASPFRSKKKLY